MEIIIKVLSVALVLIILLSSCEQRELITYEESELQPLYWRGDTVTHGRYDYKVNQIYYWPWLADKDHKGILYRIQRVGTMRVIPEIFEEDLIIKI